MLPFPSPGDLPNPGIEPRSLKSPALAGEFSLTSTTWVPITQLIAVLFTIAKTWKQPKCPSADEWIKQMWCLYTVEYYSAIKKSKIMPFAATWIQLEIIILSKIRETKTNTT